MSAVAAGEIGVEARAALTDIVRGAVNGTPVADYVAGRPLEWSVLADGGWDQLGIPEADGGPGATLRDIVEVGFAWGEALVPLPLVPSLLAKRWSRAAREHDGPVSYAVATPATPARSAVPFAAEPGLAVLAGTSRDGGVRLAEELADFEADDYAPSLALGTTATATLWHANARSEAVVVWAAECTGAASRVLRDSVAYVSQREQFGRPVGSFQAVKHHLASAHMLVQEAESAVIWAANESERALQAGLLAMDNAARVVEIGIQVHGGLGFTWEMGLHLFLRHTVALRELALALHG